MIQMDNTEKSLGPANAVKFYAGINFPATMYVCRFTEDNDITAGGLGVPEWILHEFEDNLVDIRTLQIADSDESFGCYYKQVIIIFFAYQFVYFLCVVWVLWWTWQGCCVL